MYKVKVYRDGQYHSTQLTSIYFHRCFKFVKLLALSLKNDLKPADRKRITIKIVKEGE